MFLKEPKLREPDLSETPELDKSFSPGDRVWLTRRKVLSENGGLPVRTEGQDVVVSQSGNLVHLQSHGPVHPRQIRKIIEEEEEG